MIQQAGIHGRSGGLESVVHGPAFFSLLMGTKATVATTAATSPIIINTSNTATSAAATTTTTRPTTTGQCSDTKRPLVSALQRRCLASVPKCFRPESCKS